MSTENLKKIIKNEFDFLLNFNQHQQVRRLFFEIKKSQQKTTSEIISYLKEKSKAKNHSGRNKFFALKKTLLDCRFPLTSEKSGINERLVFLNQLKPPLTNNYQVTKKFKPFTVFFEEKIKDTSLLGNFGKKFPKTPIKKISSLKDYLKTRPLEISQLKKPLVFIVKEISDFIKPCPCTKGHLSCGYWIFNLGFGCPYDCSYCYLQQYSNSPGIIIPENLGDFFKRFDEFEKNLKKPIRIGTGEFSDSLALDHITGYSKQLISYFSKKRSFFELKTKSNKIKNILESKPSPNIVISWSLNPEKIIISQEKGVASLKERLAAAKKIQKAGFKIGFHLDPIIHFCGWQDSYQDLITKIYMQLEPPFAWISLGTLRCNRKLKSITEQRFPKSNIFYGELFLGKDKKLRYPEFIRIKVYSKIFQSIRSRDPKTPVYLCMENREVWKEVSKIATNQRQNPLTHQF